MNKEAFSKSPLLSIITVNYNNAAGLSKTIQSVFAQTFKGYEFIIIDGGSKDSSRDLIVQQADKLSYWVSEKDEGVYDAMNKGILSATGKYIMFLNSGDWLLHEKVFLNFRTRAENKTADIYYGNIELENENALVSPLSYPAQLTLDFWKRSTINHQASFIKASLFREVGLYDTRYTLAADYAFYLKNFVCGKKFEHINEEWVHYKLDGASAVNRDVYKQQMKTAWENIIPGYLDNLYNENTASSQLMKHRMMQWANKLNDGYKTFKDFFKK